MIGFLLLTIILRQMLDGGVTPPASPVLARARQSFSVEHTAEQEFSMQYVARQTIQAVNTVTQTFEVRP